MQACSISELLLKFQKNFLFKPVSHIIYDYNVTGFELAVCKLQFVFSWITLSSFCEICESKLSLCWNFCLQGNHKVSVYTYILLQKVLNCTWFSCIWIAFWLETPNGSLQRFPIPSNCWNFSLNLCGSLLKR